MNITLLLSMAAEGMPDRPAVGRRGATVSYSELLDHAGRIAGWIAARDAGKVAMLGVNSDLGPALLFGAAIAGRRFVPLNYRLADDRLAWLVSRLAPVLVIADDGATARIDGDRVEVLARTLAMSEISAAAPLPATGESPDEVALLLFTSGTTDEPKAAVSATSISSPTSSRRSSSCALARTRPPSSASLRTTWQRLRRSSPASTRAGGSSICRGSTLRIGCRQSKRRASRTRC